MPDSGTFKFSFKSGSPGATLKLAKNLGEELRAGDVLALEGDLGSGKTIFVQGLGQGMRVKHPDEIRSPTFSLIQEYSGAVPLCHADLYRLRPGEAMHLGLEEYWQSGHWAVAVEWAERAKVLIPKSALQINFEFVSPKERLLQFSGGARWKKTLDSWKKNTQK